MLWLSQWLEKHNFRIVIENGSSYMFEVQVIDIASGREISSYRGDVWGYCVEIAVEQAQTILDFNEQAKACLQIHQ